MKAEEINKRRTFCSKMSLSTRSGKDEEKAACDIQKGENDVSKTSPVQSEQNGSVGDQPTTKPNREVPSNSSDKETDQPSRGSKEGVGSTKSEETSNFISDFGRKCRGDPAYLDNLRHSLYLALALFALVRTKSNHYLCFCNLLSYIFINWTGFDIQIII